MSHLTQLRIAIPGLVVPASGAEELAHLSHLQQQAGDGGSGVIELLLRGVLTEHAVQRLAELDELSLRRNTGKKFGPCIAPIKDGFNNGSIFPFQVFVTPSKIRA